jgi:hypothetical protein
MPDVVLRGGSIVMRLFAEIVDRAAAKFMRYRDSVEQILCQEGVALVTLTGNSSTKSPDGT